MKEQRFDIHQHITDQIVAAIEAGAGEFRLPWHRAAGSIMRPVNVASKKAYRGVNVLALWAAADAKGYASGTWGTYQAMERGRRAGEEGREGLACVFYKEIAVAARRTARTRPATRLFARATPVFAAEQVDGYPPPPDAPPTRSSSRSRPPRRSSPRQVPSSITAEAAPSTGPHRQHPLAAARSLHRHRDQHRRRGLLFDEIARADPLDGRARRAAIVSSASVSAIRPTPWRSLSPSSGAAFLCADLGISAAPRADHAQYLGDLAVAS